MKKEDKAMLEELKARSEVMAPYEKYFSMAVHNFIRITPEDTRKLLEACYGPDWRSKVKPSVLTCSTCKLTEIKKLAIEYYGMVKTIQDIEAKNNKKTNASTKGM